MKKLVAVLGLAASLAHAQIYPGYSSGQVLTASSLNAAFAQAVALSGSVMSGPLTVPSLTVVGGLPLSGLAPQAANTVLGNATSGTATPTALPVLGCSATNSALQWTTSTGFACNTTLAVTSGTLGQFAATTSATLAGVVSDETGSGSLVFANAPVINGVTSGAAAAAGQVGQIISSDVPIGSAVSFAVSGNSYNVTSVVLTPGDWDCDANFQSKSGGTTVTSLYDGWLSTSSATPPTGSFETAGLSGVFATMPAGTQPGFSTARVPFNVTVNTTVFMSGAALFTTSTFAGYGKLFCRRVH